MAGGSFIGPVPFWDTIASAPYRRDPDATLFNEATMADEGLRKLLQSESPLTRSPMTCAEFRTILFSQCNLVEVYAREFFDDPPSKVVDIGAGNGVNSIPMMAKGAVVHLIENEPALLPRLYSAVARTLAPGGPATIDASDIETKESFGEGVDLVLAVDVLNYLNPTSLESTMRKIHSCLKDKGILVGTLFTTEEPEKIREILAKVGCHYLDGGEPLVKQFLGESNFTVEKIEKRAPDQGGGYRFKAIKA